MRSITLCCANTQSRTQPYMHTCIYYFFLCTFRTHDVGEAVAVSIECVPGKASSGGGGFTASVFGANLCMPLSVSVSPKPVSPACLSPALFHCPFRRFSLIHTYYIHTRTHAMPVEQHSLSAHSPPRLSRSRTHMHSHAHTCIIVFIVTVHDSSWESAHHFSV